MGKKVKKESNSPYKETFESNLNVVIKTPATAVLLLRSPEEDILIKACELIYTFADKGDESKVSLLGLGALEPLCQLITHNSKLVRRNAFIALGTMATNGDVKVALSKTDVIPLIIDKLSLEDDAVIHEFATLCLASLSVSFTSKAQVFDNNGLPPLVKLLSSPDPDVKKNSLEVIFNLVQDFHSCLAIRELGAIRPLLELLNSDFPVIQHLALKILQNITTDKDTQIAFREEHGFDRVIDMLNNMRFRDLHADAVQVVANCLCDDESVQLIHKDGGLIRLMGFLLTPSTPEIQSSAVKCIARVAHSSEGCSVLHEQNVEKVLVELLCVEDVTVKTSACQAVAAMSFHLASKDRFRDLGGIPVVVQSLSSECAALREEATQALSSLTFKNKPSVFAVFEVGGHEILIQRLCESCSRTVAKAAATLCNMAQYEVIRCSILSHGAVPALVEPLKSTDTQVLVNTTLCLGVLLCETGAMTEFKRAGGLQPLVSLLQSNHKEVLHNTCFAVNVFASDKPSAVEICKYGAVEMLQDINQSVNRRSSLSKLTLVNLLNTNLSLKYNVTGLLAATDIISDGFYDAGKADAGHRVLTLEELSEQPVNHCRPIIVINTTEKKTEVDRQEHKTKTESPADKMWNMIDVPLQSLIQKVKESILPLHEKEQYTALARLVSEVMGDAVEKEKLHGFPWVSHLNELKFQLQSNIIPIGSINKGFYCHRALLFKCLADCIGMSCTLVRGEYNRAWNEVLLFEGNPQPCRYIVDLMHEPGRLLAAGTAAAVAYQTI
ncbi:armadillo repeat-containing protein 3 [Betta splendens]|uniref:Armadillo repeat-containing protein 3 n=1 Tax=Betta splendens TaxID=158456 RepID=A0A6P7M6H5_BETSP|nr:armadillo repeat-containing protein 3 [Betta splendens]